MDSSLDDPLLAWRLQLHSINRTQCKGSFNHNEQLDDAAQQSIISGCRYRSRQTTTATIRSHNSRTQMNRIELCALSAFHGSLTGPLLHSCCCCGCWSASACNDNDQYQCRCEMVDTFFLLPLHRHCRRSQKANVTSSDQFWLTSHAASCERGLIMFRLGSLDSTLALLLRIWIFCVLEELRISSNIVSVSVLVVNNNMLNIKINTSRVKVIAFFSSSTSIIICSASCS